MSKKKPTPEEVEKGLTDLSAITRKAWAERLDFTPTATQVERGLTDLNASVRWKWSRRLDFSPTCSQVSRGLTRQEDRDERPLWVERLDFKMTSEQAEALLNDEYWRLRYSCAKRSDFKSTPEQAEKGLVDEDHLVRGEWELRQDVSLSLPALERVMSSREKNDQPPLPSEVERRLRAAEECSQLTVSIGPVLRQQEKMMKGAAL